MSSLYLQVIHRSDPIVLRSRPLIAKLRPHRQVHRCILCKRSMGINPWKVSAFCRLAHPACIKRKQRKRGGSRYGDE